MKKQLTEIIQNNWFFVAVLSFVMVLPFSQALVSIFSGILLFTALVEDSWSNKYNRFKKNNILLFLPAIFFLYILSALSSGNFTNSLYDLNKTLFYLVIPTAFLFGKKMNSTQKRFVFYGLSFAIIVSTVVAFVNWKFFSAHANFSVHKISLVSHIRFGFQLILAFWFFVFLFQHNAKKLRLTQNLILIGLATYYLVFLLFQQSLTGIIAVFTSTVFYIILLIFRKTGWFRIWLLLFLIVLVVVPFSYINYSIKRFYDFEKVDPENIDKKTKQGNLYWHDFNNKTVENGHFVYLYYCEEEMREEWNKVSELKFDSLAKNGYPVKATLVRYLTSKGLRKDAEGVKSLTNRDIENVENCIANYIYTDKKYSLYPRIYQTIWEYYTYTTTGIANEQSFSQRIEFAKAAFSIIKENFWLGVGTGNWKEEFRQAYLENNPSLSDKFYASSHNQYLNYLVKFGFAGFILIMFFLTYPVVRTKSYSDHFFLVFLVYMFFANFADSNFESHMGSSFFVLFYCLFLVTGKDEYLML